MTTTETARTVAHGARRVELMHELQKRYGAGGTGVGGLARRIRFWRKKYVWAFVIGGAKVLKRTVDILFALTLLFVLWPLFLVVALSIVATDRGPVFFFQTRVGLRGRKFRLFLGPHMSW